MITHSVKLCKNIQNGQKRKQFVIDKKGITHAELTTGDDKTV